MITIELVQGVGINGVYAVRQDGQRVGTIRRFGYRDPWTLTSVHYGETIARLGFDIGPAKTRAQELNYPTAAEVYEIICERIREKRRASFIRGNALEFERQVRTALIEGSNSAREAVDGWLKAIDDFANDRTDTQVAAKQWDTDKKAWVITGRWGDHQHGYYPGAPVNGRSPQR